MKVTIEHEDGTVQVVESEQVLFIYEDQDEEIQVIGHCDQNFLNELALIDVLGQSGDVLQAEVQERLKYDNRSNQA